MQYVYKTRGVCSREITLELDDNNVIERCSFKGGCPGNLLGIAKMVVGKKAADIIEEVKGTTCGMKATSCPDQLSIALTEALAARQ